MRWAEGDEVRASVHAELPAIKAALTEAYPDVHFSEMDYGWSVRASRARKAVNLCMLYWVNPKKTRLLVAEQKDIPDIVRLLAGASVPPEPDVSRFASDGTLEGNEEPL